MNEHVVIILAAAFVVIRAVAMLVLVSAVLESLEKLGRTIRSCREHAERRREKYDGRNLPE